MKPLSVYVHIPFCEKRCSYCSFVSSIPGEYDEEEYFKRLLNEISSFDFSDYSVKTVYFGGGTPSSVNPMNIKKVLDLIKERAQCDLNEVTIECNPDSVSVEKAKLYKEAGVNRISLGVQSLDDCVLKKIGRVHNADTFFSSYHILEKYFDNISCDLIIGLPGQTAEGFISDLNILTSLKNVKHISCYGLTVEEGTLMYKSGYRPDEDRSAEMYSLAVKMLKERGYYRYEVSNFAKEGCESKHNSIYWERGEYAGFGAAAHSFLNNTRYCNPDSISDYIKRKEITCEFIAPDSYDAYEETVMLALRTAKGLDLNMIKEKFGKDLTAEKEKELTELKEFIEISDGFLKVKEDAYYVMNELIVRLL